jgi:hypothetical protein
MRFFSNEAKENADDQAVAENDQERAESDGSPVPQQRSGSPWSDGPGTPASDTLSADTTTAETTDESDTTDEESPNGFGDSLRTDDSEVRHDGDDLVRDSDGPGHEDDLDLPLDGQPADEDNAATDDFRAGSHRADGEEGTTDSPTDSPTDSLTDSPADSPADSSTGFATDSPADDRVDTADGEVDENPGAEQSGGTTTTYGPDGSVTTVDEEDASSVDSDHTAFGTDDSSVDGTSVSTDGSTVDDSAVDGDETKDAAPFVADTTDSTDRTEEDRDLDEAAPVVATTPVDTTTAADSTDSATDSPTDSALADSTPTGSTPAGDTATDDDAAPAAAVDTTTTEAAKPDLAAAPVGDKLFTDGDSFNDRLRDVSLNFVDNPQEATEQAGALVDEAIDKVTSALKAQKDALAGEGTDTEKLRVQLRGYRDILKRLTAL